MYDGTLIRWKHFGAKGRKASCYASIGSRYWNAMVHTRDHEEQHEDGVTDAGGWGTTADTAIRQAMRWASWMVSR